MCENAVYRLVLSRCAIFTVYSVVPYGKGGRRYYSGLTLNQYGVTSPCPDLNLIHYIVNKRSSENIFSNLAGFEYGHAL